MLLVERHGLRRNGKETQLPRPRAPKAASGSNLHAGSDRVGGAPLPAPESRSTHACLPEQSEQGFLTPERHQAIGHRGRIGAPA